MKPTNIDVGYAMVVSDLPNFNQYMFYFAGYVTDTVSSTTTSDTHQKVPLRSSCFVKLEMKTSVCRVRIHCSFSTGILKTK